MRANEPEPDAADTAGSLPPSADDARADALADLFGHAAVGGGDASARRSHDGLSGIFGDAAAVEADGTDSIAELFADRAPTQVADVPADDWLDAMERQQAAALAPARTMRGRAAVAGEPADAAPASGTSRTGVLRSPPPDVPEPAPGVLDEGDPFAGLFVDTAPASLPEQGPDPVAEPLARATAKAERRAAKAQERAETGAAPARTTTDAEAVVPGEFAPAPRRGPSTWSARAWWSIAAAIALVAVLVAGTIVIAQTTAANARFAEALAAYEADVAAIAGPRDRLTTAIAAYDAATIEAQAAADSAAPSLAAVAGMVDPVPLDAAVAALASLVAALDAQQQPDAPEPLAPADFSGAGVADIPAIGAAGERARDHALEVQRAVARHLDEAAALERSLGALAAAQRALGATLPATAAALVEENLLAAQSFRDAVVTTAAAVGTAQKAGGSGDPELLAFAAAVTALRADEERAAQEQAQQNRPPVVQRPTPTPSQPGPVPDPAPSPDPTPDPGPTDPAPTP